MSSVMINKIRSGQVWGDQEDQYLVVDHEECGFVFLRAVNISNPYCQYQLSWMRGDDLVERFDQMKLVKLSDTLKEFYKPKRIRKKVSKKK